MSNIIEIAIADIRVPEGRRALDLVKVKEIAASITLLGMLSPIGVRRHGDGPVDLVWGGHRLAASVNLGRKTIAAIAVDGLGWDKGHRENADLEDFVKMTEIAENLHRSDLNTQERNEQLATWVALLEKRTKPISNAEQPITKSRPGRKPSPAIAEVAKASGLTTKTVREAIKTTTVSPEVRAAADDAGLSNRQRLAISRRPEANQLEGVAKLAASKPGAAGPSDDQRKAALRLAVVNENVVMFTPKADDDGSGDADLLAGINDGVDDVDLNDHSVGAHVIYGSLSSIDLAKTTPEIFWTLFGTPNGMPGTAKWLDTAIRKLTEIKAAQSEADA